jgi:hypothetical protein
LITSGRSYDRLMVGQHAPEEQDRGDARHNHRGEDRAVRKPIPARTEERGYSSGIRPSAPSHRGEAKKACTEEHDRRRLGYGDLANHYLAVAGVEIGHQDRVDAGVEGAATTTLTGATWGFEAAATAAVPAAPAGGNKSATTTTKTAADVASGETWECASSSTGKIEGTSTEKAATATTAGAAGAGAATVAAGTPTATTTATAITTVRAGETAPAGERHSPRQVPSTATTTAASDDQRRVIRADHERATTAPAAEICLVAARTADGDLQDLPCGQGKIAADLRAKTAYANYVIAKVAVAALRAEGEDLIGVGGRHREGDQVTGISEVERHGAGRQP